MRASVKFSSLCLSLSLLNAAYAAPEAAAPTDETQPQPQPAPIESLTLESLSAILNEAGAENVKPAGDGTTVLFKSGERNYFVTLAGCDESGVNCAMFTIGRAFKAKLPVEVLNKLNEEYSGLLAATRVNETTMKISHAAIVGGGVMPRNIAINLAWFVNQSPEFEDFLKNQLVASTTPDKSQPVPVGLPFAEVTLTPAEITTGSKPMQLPGTFSPMKGKK